MLIAALAASAASAQEKPEAPQPQQAPPPGALQDSNATPTATTAPGQTTNAVEISLTSALALARKNSIVYNAAVTEAASAGIDRALARDALLPQVNFNNEYLYTQSNNHGGVRYIANNAVHEYTSQGNVHEAFDITTVANYRRISATAALARAKAEIASRGLVVTVTQNYFNVLSAQFKFDDARRASDEGSRFLQLTQQLEQGGEVAHSDTIKAEMQAQDRQRQFQEAKLALMNARLDLSVLLFPDLQDNFVLTDDLRATAVLPTIEEVQQQAARGNPDLRAALETLHMTTHEVTAARAGYLPSLTLDYFYGIDAPNFATRSFFQGERLDNLGSSALGSDRDRTSRLALHPALSVELVALREHERRSRPDRGAVDRHAQAVLVGDRDHLRLVLERLQLPDLVVAAIAFGNDDRVARPGGLVGGPGQTVEAKSAGRQVAAVLVTERLIRLSSAAPDRQALARLILAGRHDQRLNRGFALSFFQRQEQALETPAADRGDFAVDRIVGVASFLFGQLHTD